MLNLQIINASFSQCNILFFSFSLIRLFEKLENMFQGFGFFFSFYLLNNYGNVIRWKMLKHVLISFSPMSTPAAKIHCCWKLLHYMHQKFFMFSHSVLYTFDHSQTKNVACKMSGYSHRMRFTFAFASCKFCHILLSSITILFQTRFQFE